MDPVLVIDVDQIFTLVLCSCLAHPNISSIEAAGWYLRKPTSAQSFGFKLKVTFNCNFQSNSSTSIPSSPLSKFQLSTVSSHWFAVIPPSAHFLSLLKPIHCSERSNTARNESRDETRRIMTSVSHLRGRGTFMLTGHTIWDSGHVEFILTCTRRPCLFL